MTEGKKFLVVNFTSNALNYLPEFLANKQMLQKYVRPYVNKERYWERALAKLPFLKGPYQQTLGRRKLPDGLAPENIHEVAVLEDFLAAIFARLGAMGFKPGADLARTLQYSIQRKIGKAGAVYGRDADLVAASYLVALQAFQQCSGLKVLNYPIAHHRYIQRFVTEEAECEPEFASTLPNWNEVPKWIEPQLDAECELADRILIGSSFARDSFIAEGIPAEKMLVVPYGANVSLFSPNQEPNNHRRGLNVLFVGQIGQRKGISYLLRAYRTFRGPDTSLTLVGHFCGNPKIFNPYRELFEHVSHVPRGVLANLFRQADVFVFPTLIEGMGLVVVEAMASGLPVIVTPNGPGDIVRDGIDGFIVPIRDPDAIADRLEYFRANPEARIEMGRNARQRALQFTWEAYGERVISALGGLLENSASSDHTFALGEANT